jgi:hypothetical protein
MQRYRFQWSHHPDRVLLALCRELGLGLADPAASLRGRYGARPDEGFVWGAFPVLIAEAGWVWWRRRQPIGGVAAPLRA